nr:hypothetical protein [Segniliparus rotundus]
MLHVKASLSSHPARSTARIGATFTSIAAVPASTRRSPWFSATMYRPNQSRPLATIPGQAFRAGSPSRRIAQTGSRTSVAIPSLPSARAPGSYCLPAARIATNAEAQKNTVAPAATAAFRPSSKEKDLMQTDVIGAL